MNTAATQPSHTIADILARMVSHRISRSEAIVLLHLAHHNAPLPIGRLARPCGCTTAAITGTIDTMTRKGLLRRVNMRGDRRKVHVELTNRGETIVRETFNI